MDNVIQGACEKYKQAKRLYAAKQYSESLVLLDELAAKFPNDVHVMHGRARCFAKLGQPLNAIDLSKRILTMHDHAKSRELLNYLQSELKTSKYPTHAPGSTLETPIDDPQVPFRAGHLRRWAWFSGANMAILAVFMLLAGNDFAVLFPFILIFSAFGPFVSLAMSKTLACWAHNIRILERSPILSQKDAHIYDVVESLAIRTGLARIPKVGIYESPDMNAFATGATKNHALIAFSTELLERLDDKQMAAVAAHEIAHIATGDMVSMTLTQSVVNIIVALVSAPFLIWRWMLRDAWFASICVESVRFLFRGIILLGGYLVMMAFSRRREYAADALAARLTSSDAMVSALTTLAEETEKVPIEQASYACLKISSPMKLLELFSSHPHIEKRIAKLKRLG